MKRSYIYIGLLFFVILGISSCYRDVIIPTAAEDPNGPPAFVSFKNDLEPIFTSSCALAGCHVSGSQQPYLTSDVSYLQLTNGGYVNTIVPNQSILYTMINGQMEVHIPAAADRKKVYDWIRNGAPNN